MQSKLSSIIEVSLDMAVGFGISLIVTRIMWSLLEIEGSASDNFLIVSAFTVVSLVRRYCTRRIANWFHIRQANKRRDNLIKAMRYGKLPKDPFNYRCP